LVDRRFARSKGAGRSTMNRALLALAVIVGMSVRSESPAGSIVDAGGAILHRDQEGPRPHIPVRRPNIMIIVTDDQRAGSALQVMPSTRRWFVRDGTSFTRAFATTPLCCPSRASIFTGDTHTTMASRETQTEGQWM
jgi:hypothetical protein